MNRPEPKRRRIRLQPDSYIRLCRQVLERDNWRCQNCGVASELQIHHIQFRSHLGDDREENLVTLCAACHRALHHPAMKRNRTE
jgi:5-methylcytosine-specific restriction endonuclease McrA